MSIAISKEIKGFWRDFVLANKHLEHLLNYKFEAWSFGNTPDMANDLGSLVLSGKKVATCSLLRAYEGEEGEIPRVGLYSVLCNGSQKPIAIIYLTHTWICKYNEVTKEHAFNEGEGDQSLEHWKKAHFDFFSQYEGFHEEDVLICEKFVVAYK